MKKAKKLSTICEVHRHDNGAISHLHWKAYRHQAESLTVCCGNGYRCSITVDKCQKPKDENGRYVLARPLVPDE